MGEYEEAMEVARKKRDESIARAVKQGENAVMEAWDIYDAEVDKAREELPVLEGVEDA